MKDLDTAELRALAERTDEWREFLGARATPLIEQLEAFSRSGDGTAIDRALLEESVRAIGEQALASPSAWSSDYSRRDRALAFLRSLPSAEITTYGQTRRNLVLIVGVSPLGIVDLEWVHSESLEAAWVNDAGSA